MAEYDYLGPPEIVVEFREAIEDIISYRRNVGCLGLVEAIVSSEGTVLIMVSGTYSSSGIAWVVVIERGELPDHLKLAYDRMVNRARRGLAPQEDPEEWFRPPFIFLPYLREVLDEPINEWVDDTGNRGVRHYEH